MGARLKLQDQQARFSGTQRQAGHGLRSLSGGQVEDALRQYQRIIASFRSGKVELEDARAKDAVRNKLRGWQEEYPSVEVRFGDEGA